MVDNILKFDPVVVGEGFRFDGDQILEAAKGKNWRTLVILGETDDDDDGLYIAGNANAGESIILMEIAKRRLIFGDE